MADRYWVGGTGTWTTTTTNWSATSGGASGASAPTAADNVIFDQAATYTVTLTGALTCLNFTVSAGTVTFTSTGTPTISGSMSLVSGTVWSATGTITFNSTTAQTITTNGVTINGNITFNGVAGNWSLGSALTTGATRTTTITNGTITLNGFTLTTGIFGSTGVAARAIAFDTNNIVLAHTTAATTVLNMSTVTGFTYTGTGGFTASAAVTRTYQFGITGGSTTNAPNLTLTGSGTAVQTFDTGSWFNTLSFGTTAFNPGTTALNLNGLTLSSGGTFTTLTPTMRGTGTLTSSGNTTLAALTINSTAGTITLGAAFAMSATSTFTLTAGTLDLGGFDLTTGIFSSTNTNTRSVAFGTTNIVLSHTTAAQTVLSMATATGFTYTGTGGFTASAAVTRTFNFGATAGGSATTAPNVSLTGSGTAVQTFTTASWFNTLSFGTTAFNPGTTALNLNGLTLSSGGTYTTLTATMRGTGTITPAGKTIAAFTVNNDAGTVTLAAALGVTTYTQTAGTINFATFNLTCSGAVAYTAGTLNNIGTISCTTWTVTGAFTLSSGTITPSTSFVLTSGSFTYSGGTLSAVPTFTHTAGTVTLSQNYSLTSTGTYTLTAGTLTLNGFDLTTGIFSSSNANTRSVAFGTNNIVLAHTTAAQTVLSMATVTSFTYTGTGGFTATAAVTRTYTFGTLGIPVYFPNLSLTGSGTAVQTFTTGSYFTNLSFGTTAFNPGTTALNIYGSLTLSSGGTFTTLTPTMRGTGTLTSNSNTTLAALTINASGGTITLGAAFALAATGTFTLTSGTLDLGGFDLTTGIFSSSGITTRSIVFGTNNIVLAHTTAAQTVLQMTSATNFSWTGTGGFTASAAVTRTYVFGSSSSSGTITNAPNLTLTGSGTAVQTFDTGSWFKNLSFGTTAFDPGITALNIAGGLTLSSGGTFTTLTPTLLGTGTITSSGNTTLAALTVNTTGTITLGAAFALGASRTFTLTAGTLDLGGFDLTTGIFSSDNTNTRSVAFGTTNIVLAHTSAGQTVLSMATATGFTWSGTGGFTATAAITRTYVFGTTGGTETNSPNLAITSGSAVPTITTNSWFNALNFTGTTSTPATTTVFVNTLTLATGGTYTSLTPIFTSTQTWTTQFSKQLGGIGFNLAGGTLTLGGTQSLIATATTTLTAGTLDLDGYDLTTGIFSSTNTNTRSITFGTNNIVLSHTSASQTVLSMATATGFTWSGTGGFTSDASVTRTFSFGSTAGGTETNSPNLAITSGSVSLTITTNSWFNALNFTGTTSSTNTTTVFVNTLTLASGGTYTGLTPIFTSTQTWTPQFSKQLAAIGVNIPGGTLTLGGTQSLVGTTDSTLTAGTLDLGGYDLVAGNFSSSNTNTRSIVFGSNNITIAGSAGFVLSMATATNFTWTGTGGFVSNLAVARSFQFGSTAGGSATNSPNLAITSGAAIATISTNSWFNTLDFTGTTSTVNSTAVFVSTLTLATGGTYTGLSPIFTRTQTWTTQFSKQLLGIGFNLTGGTLTLGDSPSLVATGTTTLTNGTLDLGGFDLTTGIFSSNNANTRSVVFGTNNIVLVTTTAATVVLSMATATGFTCTGTGGFTTDASVTRTITVGSTAGDATNAPDVSLTGAGIAVVTITSTSFIKNLTFGSTAFALPTNTLNIVGDLTLSSGGTFTSLTLNMVGTGTITSNGKTILALTINSVSGTTSLSDALTTGATATTTLTSGNLALNGYTLTTGIFSSSNSNARSIAFGTGNIVLATTNGSAINLVMSTATNFTCTSDGTYGSGTGGFQSTLSLIRTFQFGNGAGGSAANAPRLYFVSGAESPSITTGSWFSEIDFGTTAIPSLNPMNQNLSSLKSDLSTSVLTSLTATMVGTGSIRTNTSIGPLVINTSAITTTLAGTTLCTTAALTLGTLDLAGQTLTCSSTFTYNGGSLLTASGVLNCTTFTINGPAFDFTTGTITPSTSFVLTSGSFTLNGGTLSAVPTFTHTAGTVAFNTSFSLAATGTYTFTAGTLTLADGVTLSTGIFSSTNTNTRSIAFGATTAGYISLTHTTAAITRLSMAIVTGFTESGPGGFTSSMGVTATFTFGTTGGSSSNAPNLAITSGASIPTFTTGSWFDLLDFTGSTSTPAATVLNLNAITLASGGTYTALGATMRGTGTITPNGKTIAAFTVNNDTGTVTLAAALGVTTYTQTAGIIDFATFNLTCSGAAAYTSGTLNNIGTITCTTWTVTGAFTFGQGTITPSTSFVLTSGSFTYNSGATLSAVPTFTHTAGTVTLNQSYALTTTGTYTLTAGTLTLVDGVTVNTGIFSSTNSNTRSIAFGSASAGNINLTHTTAATTVLSMTTATGFTLTGTGGFTVADMSNTRTFNFGATAGGSVTNAPSLTFTTGASIATLTTAGWFDNLNFGTTSFILGTTALNIAGSLTLANGTYTSLTPTMRDTGTITSNGKTISALIVNTTGTATLAAALTASGAITLTEGTLDCSTFSVTSATFASTGSLTRSMSGTGTYTITGAGATAFSNASATGITITGLIISMTAATAKTFAGGGGSFSTLNQGGAGALTISGDNSLADLTATTRPSTITFTASSTQTFANFTLSGISGSLVTINSSAPGTRAILSKASGTVSAGFLSIQDSDATGGAEWYAGTTSTNVSNNLGWIFTAPPVVAYAGNFFAFF